MGLDLVIGHHVKDRIGKVGRNMPRLTFYLVGNLDSNVPERYPLRDVEQL